jgi:hypothetical protein
LNSIPTVRPPTSGADSPFGSSNTLGTASFSRGDTSVDFSKDFPVLSDCRRRLLQAPASRSPVRSFTNGYMRGEVEQTQVKGAWKVLEASELKFGGGATKVDNRSAFSNNQRDTWGGATKPSDYPSSVFHKESVSQYFDQISGHNNPALFNQFYTFNFNEVRKLAAAASGLPNLYLPKTTFDNDPAPRKRPRPRSSSSTPTGIPSSRSAPRSAAAMKAPTCLDRAGAGGNRHPLGGAERIADHFRRSDLHHADR